MNKINIPTRNDTVYLIPHFNDLAGLELTLKSIKNEPADILIIDDGSDNKPVLEDLKSRIDFCSLITFEIYFCKMNVGITRALNLGLNLANDGGYKFVARIDSGDRVIGERVAQQKQYLLNNKASICATHVEFVNEERNHLFYFKSPIGCSKINTSIKMYNPFIHPSVMYVLDDILSIGGYPDQYPALEDWALFLKASKYYKLVTLNRVLTQYVVSPNSISTLKRKTQAQSKIRLLKDNFEFNAHSIIGLIRNYIVLFLPREFLTQIKRYIYK